MAFALVLVLAAVVVTVAAESRGGDAICGGGCLWVNAMWARKSLPVQGSLQSGDVSHVFCHRGLDPFSLEGVTHLWHGLAITVTAQPPGSLSVTVGNSSTAARAEDAPVLSLSAHHPTQYLSLFELFVCVGLTSSAEEGSGVGYKFDAVQVVMWRYPSLLGAGLVLLLAAPTLSRSVTIHYSAGTAVGVIALVLILLFLLSKLVPYKRSLFGVGVLAGGTSVFLYSLYWFLDHLTDLVRDMWQYFLAYLIVAGLISFAAVYRWGPVTNPRSLDLIQWSLQLVAMVMIFTSGQTVGCSVALVVLSLLLLCTPSRFNPFHYLVLLLLFPLRLPLAILSFLNPMRLFYRRPRPRLLTTEEYEEQGRVETKKALLQLREDCRSDRRIWHTVSHLRDPRRFTDFLSGQEHVTSDERSDHEWSFVVDSSDSEESLEHSQDDSPNRSSSSSGDSPTFVKAARRSIGVSSSPPHPPLGSHRLRVGRYRD